jgi:superfamily II DNA or RNA helicase
LERVDPEKDISPELLQTITLWEHQLQAIRAAVNEPSGHIHASTASGKTAIAAAIAIAGWREHGHRSLILAASKGNAMQIAKELRRFCGEGIDIGFIGDGVKRPGDITVATSTTLARAIKIHEEGRLSTASALDQNLVEYLKTKVDRLLVDECHRAAGASYYAISLMCESAKQSLGLSGTPVVKKRLRDLRMVAATGPCVFRHTAQAMIAAGLAALPKILVVCDDRYYSTERREEVYAEMMKQKGFAKSPYRIRNYRADYEAYYVKNPKHNRRIVLGAAKAFADHNLPTLVIARRLPQLRWLKRKMEQTGHAYAVIDGSTPTVLRELYKKQLSDGGIKVLLASDLMSTGEDMPNCRALVFAEGVQSYANAMQRIGRGMRRKTTGLNEVWVVDPVPPPSRVLLNHATKRIEAYEEAGYAHKVCRRFNAKKLVATFSGDWPAPAPKDDASDQPVRRRRKGGRRAAA